MRACTSDDVLADIQTGRERIQSQIQWLVNDTQNVEQKKSELQIGEALDALASDLDTLQNEINNATRVLVPYDQRKCELWMRELESEYDSARTVVLPRKRFQFAHKFSYLKQLSSDRVNASHKPTQLTEEPVRNNVPKSMTGHLEQSSEEHVQLANKSSERFVIDVPLCHLSLQNFEILFQCFHRFFKSSINCPFPLPSIPVFNFLCHFSIDSLHPKFLEPDHVELYNSYRPVGYLLQAQLAQLQFSH